MKVMPNRFEDMFAHWKMPNQVVNSTCLYDSMLFLGTDEGLTVMRDGERVKTLPLTKAVTASGKDLEETDLIEYLDKVRIRSVISDSRGNLWISTWTGDGLVRYAKGEIMVFTPEDGMASEKCRAVSECGDGSMLVAQTGGMSVIKDDRVAAVYTQEEGIENLGVLTVSEGFEGEYILGTDGGGLYIIENGEVTHIGSENGLASDVILRVRRSRAENVIWIVTGNSLAYMTPDHQVTTIESFPYANNYDLYENNKGELWVLSSSGIYVARTGQLLANAVIETAHYNIFNGLPYTATSNSYSELADDGNLYIAGSSGVIRVNIEEPFEANVEMKMSVPFVDADGVRIWPDADGNFTIPSDTHKLTVSSFVLNYAPVNPKVSYYLQSFDREPITVSLSDLTPVDYTNLKGGEYSFVMDMEDEDLSGNREVSVLIRKELAVNEQPWFWFTVLIFILMGEIWLIHIILEKMTRMIEKKKDRERIAGDLQLASQIQAAVLPKNSFEDAGKRFGLSGSMTPAKEVGGDFYDYYMIDDDHLAMIIADVSGKGIPAALFMMVSKALIKNQLMSGLTPAQALANVNQQLCENNESGMFVTVWAAVLEISTGKGLACNAGHENPGIRQGGGSFELAVYKHNLFLGVSKKAEYTDRPFEMKTGDSLFVYTDGVPEAHDPNGQMFGSQRLGEALNIDPDAGPEKLIENVRSTVREFAGKAEQYDDITMLAFKYYNSSFIG